MGLSHLEAVEIDTGPMSVASTSLREERKRNEGKTQHANKRRNGQFSSLDSLWRDRNERDRLGFAGQEEINPVKNEIRPQSKSKQAYQRGYCHENIDHLPRPFRQFKRHSNHITRTSRWKAIRLRALRRDGFQCVQCGARGRLEVDHIKPVRTHPELAFDLDNLQSLCARHHAQKTRIECGHKPPSPERLAWREAVNELSKQPNEKG